MKKTNKISALLMMCLMLISSFTFTSCDKDDVSTDQYTGGVKLNVFGPCPVARGGELRFLGSGMNQIQAVVIPGCEQITDITVISDKEIRVMVPQTAEVGKVVLIKKGGEEITTVTNITYSEPIAIEKLSPATVKPGNILTIDGEYLNLINEVIFADGVIVPVEDFSCYSFVTRCFYF